MADKGKSPAFQFYAAEWLADENVRLMTLEETGAYIDALAICWREGSVPACPEMLARLIGKGCSTDVATVVQRLFNVRCTDERFSVERLKHKRLEIEREKQRVRSEQAAKAGKKSADVKREGKEKPKRGDKSNVRSTPVQRTYNPSSSSSDEDVPPVLRTEEFLKSWKEWQAHRREIKEPLTETQTKKQLRQFEQWGASRAIAAINNTILKGWTGLREPDGNGPLKPKQGQFSRDVFDEFLNDGGSNG